MTKADDHWVMINWLLSPSSDPWAGLRKWWARVCRWSPSWSARQQQSSWETAESWKAGAILVICWGTLKKILGDPVRDFEERRSEVESLDCFLRRGVAESRLLLLHAVCLDFEPFDVFLLFGFCLLRARTLFFSLCGLAFCLLNRIG